MATMNRPIIILLTVIQIWNKYLKFQLNRVVYLCLCNICTKFQIDTSFLSWVLFNNLTSICSTWQRPWNHSTNIFILIFILHRIHCWISPVHFVLHLKLRKTCINIWYCLKHEYYYWRRVVTVRSMIFTVVKFCS